MINRELVSVKGVESQTFGFLTWYTVPDSIRVTRETLENAFVSAGIDLTKMPDPIRPHDAFRRATSSVALEHVPVGKDRFKNYLVREVRCSKDEIRRHLVAETVDSAQEVLSYQEVGAMRLLRRYTPTMVTELFPAAYDADEDREKIVEMLQTAEERYRTALKYYEGDHIRRLIASILSDMSPTLVRQSGAVYFVPKEYERNLNALGTLAKKVGAEFEGIPVMDAANVRELVLNAFKQQTAAVVAELAEALKDPNITPKKVAVLLDQAKSLLGQVREYEDLLEKKLTDLRTQVEIVQMQMMALLDKAVA
jgi:hypothetical protein